MILLKIIPGFLCRDLRNGEVVTAELECPVTCQVHNDGTMVIKWHARIFGYIMTARYG